MRIILAGGGTGGPVVPLLAVAENLKAKNPDTDFLFVGSKTGPEQGLVEAAGLKYATISSGRWRRYLSIRNITDTFLIAAGFIQAYRLLSRYKPDLIFTVGGSVGVPLAWAGKLKGVKILIHQQDALPGLANRVVAPFAAAITTAFEETSKNFYSNLGIFRNERMKRIEWVGNPVRAEFFSKDLPYKDFFGLHDQLPVLLITGGGTGAAQINDVVKEALPELVKSHQVVHISGKGKLISGFKDSNYHQYEFLSKEMSTIMKMADIVVSRAGLSTISELSILGKIAIVVPMPDSHQEANAQILLDRSAAIVLYKEEFTTDNLVKVVNAVKFNVERQKLLIRGMSALMPRDAASRISGIINQLVHAGK
jgi:UDP-N-acetylglucosamine--N-acetylmuramyl-(pentapeptide) pyrophosphoryl-undecaprenol N-acetylglucosamine transferase